LTLQFIIDQASDIPFELRYYPRSLVFSSSICLWLGMSVW